MNSKFEKDERRAATMAKKTVKDNWPTTLSPQLFTQYPISMPYTNPPLTIPLVQAPPKGPPIMVPPPGDADVRAASGTGNNDDFRTDLSQYRLVVVKEKDVPDVAGYNPHAKLKYYPKGVLPGSNETFYLVTHKFADKAGINEIHRGYINIKADALGQPTYPLMAYINKLGLPRKTETQTGAPTNTESKYLDYVNTGLLGILLLVLLMILVNLRKKNHV